MQLKNKGVRMTKEVKSKLIEIGAGLVLYLNALFAVKQWNTDSRVELMLYIFAYIVILCLKLSVLYINKNTITSNM